MALASATVGLAAGVDGKWEGSVQGPEGPLALTFEFKSEGETVTGSVESPMGKVDISNGKIKDSLLTFDVTLGDGTLITHAATVKGDEIEVKAVGPWGEVVYTIKRVVAQ